MSSSMENGLFRAIVLLFQKVGMLFRLLLCRRNNMSCTPAENPAACSLCATVTPRYVKLDIIDSGDTHSGSHWFEHDSECTWKPILPNPGTGLAFAAESEIVLSGPGLTITLVVDEEFGSSSLITDTTFDCGTVLNDLAVGVDLYTVTLSASGSPVDNGQSPLPQSRSYTMLRRITKLLGFNVDSFLKTDGKIILDQGDNVPADNTPGYAVGCLFLKRNGGDGTALWVNEGTEAACNFNAIQVGA